MLPNKRTYRHTYLAASCLDYQNLQPSLLVQSMIEFFVNVHLTVIKDVDDSPCIYQMFAPHDSCVLSQNGMFDPLCM